MHPLHHQRKALRRVLKCKIIQCHSSRHLELSQRARMDRQAVGLIIRTLIVTVCKLEYYKTSAIFLKILDEEIHRLKVQSPVDEVAELALDDIGKFPPLTLLNMHNESWSMIHVGIKISKKTPHQVLRQAIKAS